MKVFEDALPYYLKMGMTFEQYWDGDVSAHRAYRKAEKLRIRDVNQAAWLQALYVYEAIADLAPVLRAFSKGRAKPFRGEPYDLDEKERKKREEREERKRYERMKEKVAAFAKAYNQKRKEKDDAASEETENTETITPERKEEGIDNG